jgi:sugar phosphate isomerase/epimerase
MTAPKKLLNFSTHPGEPELFDDDWGKVAKFMNKWQFDGFELLPVGDYPFARIPKELIHGLHLRFFVILRQIWQNNRQGLIDMFGCLDDVQRFYGGTDRQCIIDTYVRQFELAHRLGCEYVVFHPVQCELEHIYDWQFPWHWKDTLKLCSEILNEALSRSRYNGLLLFENLWWPGSFRLDSNEEYEYLRQRVNHDRCGIVLDTGHLLNSGGGFDVESEAIAYLLKRVADMGEMAKEIRVVHLTCSLSGAYIRQSKQSAQTKSEDGFWQQLAAARKHVSRIDPHEPFTDPAIAGLFDLVEPDHVVFEFTFRGLDIWQDKIATQKQALQERLWP